jgi:hypothetical protein
MIFEITSTSSSWGWAAFRRFRPEAVAKARGVAVPAAVPSR